MLRKFIVLVVVTLGWASPQAEEVLDLLDESELQMEVDMGMGTGKVGKTTGSVPVARSPFRFTLDHSVSIKPGNEVELINNRSGIELEYEGLIYKSLFAKLDVFGNLYWANDHVAEVNNKKIYDSDYRIKEAWLQRTWSNLNIKLGAQSIVWSEVEGSYATDVINPIDNRELLFVEFDEARIAQWMASFSVYSKQITWEGFVNFLPQFNDNPPVNSIYYPPVPDDSPGIAQIEEASTPNPEFGLRGKVSLGASEVAAFVARLAPNQPSYEISDAGIREVANPFWYFGLNANYAIGQTLWKSDMGYKASITDYEKDTFDFAFGVENTWNQHVLSASINYSYILQWNNTLLTPEHSGLLSLGWSKTYLNEDLSVNSFIGSLLNRSTYFATALVDYKMNDRITLSGSLFVFSINDKESEFYPFRDENRISTKIKYQL